MSLYSFETSNVQVLYSNNFDGDIFIYDTKDKKKTTLTVEHFRTWDYGDFFVFIDAMDGTRFDGSSSGIYTELAPRVSFSKLLGSDFSSQFIDDIYIATQVNIGRSYQAYLYGLGIDFKIPGFHIFSFNAYNKDENIFTKDTYQITTVYKTKSLYGMHFEGFIDITGRDINTQNQFLYAIDVKEKAFVGVEWLYYDYDDQGSTSNTSVIQAMIKYKF